MAAESPPDADEATRRHDEALLKEVSALFADIPLNELEREIAKAREAVRARRRRGTASTQ